MHHTAFAPCAPPVAAASSASQFVCSRQRVQPKSRVWRSRTAPASMTSSTPPAATSDAERTDELFGRLSHVNKNLRVKASAEIAQMPPDQTVEKLVALLDLEDTGHRRAAVQTLGMIGMPAVPRVLEELATSENLTVRASCSKALAAVAMYFPHERESFPSEAIEALRNVVMGSPDPVTKIATVGCLTTLACDSKIAGDDVTSTDSKPAASSSSEGIEVFGNERAIEVLVEMLSEAADVALGASVCGALAQVANCGSPERKADIIAKLSSIADAEASEDDEESGFGYVREMCRSHVSQLQGGQP